MEHCPKVTIFANPADPSIARSSSHAYETHLVQHLQLGHVYVSTGITDKRELVNRDVNRAANQTSDPIGRAYGSEI